MGTKRMQMLALASLIASAFAIGACTRSASTAPTATGGVGVTGTPLTGQQATMEAVRSALLTQTAQALQGSAAATSTPTPVVAVETATPVVETPATLVSTLPGPAATPVPELTFEVPSTYTLHEGEFPFCLARRFNRNPVDLMALNGLTDATLNNPGETLLIPSTGTFPGPRALLSHPTTYTVDAGDTIYWVACYYGDVYPMAIAAVNGLSSPYTLTPGSTIEIP
jgi:LysM repeat protein